MRRTFSRRYGNPRRHGRRDGRFCNRTRGQDWRSLVVICSMPISRRILLIDDDDQVRLLAESVLRALGYTVHAVATAKEARSQLESERYDLVLADAILGDGSGIAIADEAEAKGMKAVIVTGYGMQLRSELAGHDYLLKPISTR